MIHSIHIIILRIVTYALNDKYLKQSGYLLYEEVTLLLNSNTFLSRNIPHQTDLPDHEMFFNFYLPPN